MLIKEVETKQKALETELDVALTAAKVLTPATPEFDNAYGRYLGAKANLAKIPAELAKAKVDENAGAINAAGAEIAKSILELVKGFEVEKLLGTPVICLNYVVAEAGPMVVFNPVRKVGSGGSKGGTRGGKRTVITTPTGETLNCTQFVMRHATVAEKATTAYHNPHTFVDTQPKFDAFCLSHGLSGHAYCKPENDTPAEVPPIELADIAATAAS